LNVIFDIKFSIFIYTEKPCADQCWVFSVNWRGLSNPHDKFIQVRLFRAWALNVGQTAAATGDGLAAHAWRHIPATPCSLHRWHPTATLGTPETQADTRPIAKLLEGAPN